MKALLIFLIGLLPIFPHVQTQANDVWENLEFQGPAQGWKQVTGPSAPLARGEFIFTQALFWQAASLDEKIDAESLLDILSSWDKLLVGTLPLAEETVGVEGHKR